MVKSLGLAVVLMVAFVLWRTVYAVTTAETITRVSVSSNAVQANDESFYPGISSDGRYVVFASYASNLVANDTNNVGDIFVHDRQTGATSRVSVASDGTQANDWPVYSSNVPAISAHGRFVTFQSTASNLVPDDTNNVADIFVHDTLLGITDRVSVDSNGLQANDRSYESDISADGRIVVFRSSASNLVPGYSGGLFAHDRLTGTTTFVSFGSDPSLTDDGRFVAFKSNRADLVPGDTNDSSDIFVLDRQNGKLSRVSIASNGTQGNDLSRSPAISSDGRFVAFESDATNLVADQIGERTPNIFVHDRQTGATSIISIAGDGTHGNSHSYSPTISADGRYIAFWSHASNLVAGDMNESADIFVHDRQTGLTKIASLAFDGAQANDTSWTPVLSADGRYIAFWSSASNLVTDDTNDENDIFVYDRGPVVESPTISSFNPTSGAVGSVVSINGTNLNGAETVTINNVSATINSASDELITITVPPDASTGKIAVTTPGGTAVSQNAFVVEFPQPSISSFSPTSGTVGTLVSIRGINLNHVVAVSFNGTPAVFAPVSTTELAATVPDGASTGKITVTTANGTATSTINFIVTESVPSILDFTPLSGPVGTVVTINGSGFLGTSAVEFNGALASFSVISKTKITAIVPDNVTSGAITVITTGGSVSSATDFVVTEATPTIIGFSPHSGTIGTTVTIDGANLGDANAVTFNSTPASFTIISDAQLQANVPEGAMTGKIAVITDAAIATSEHDFVVLASKVQTLYLPLSIK